MEYYVHLSDETLQKLEDAISGEPVEVVELSVTENDTYTAPSGKAYSPVVVNVSGGSSDFSTAEVTIVNSNNIECKLAFPILITENGATYINSYIDAHTGDYTIVLNGMGAMGALITDANIGVSGDIENIFTYEYVYQK